MQLWSYAANEKKNAVLTLTVGWRFMWEYPNIHGKKLSQRFLSPEVTEKKPAWHPDPNDININTFYKPSVDGYCFGKNVIICNLLYLTLIMGAKKVIEVE